jgi:hypothetical protein
VTTRELDLRREIMLSFARTGRPPDVQDPATLSALADQHVVALDSDGGVLMAHPFAAHHDGTRVAAGDSEWWGNCAWDGLGIVAALGLSDAEVASGGVSVRVAGGEVVDNAWFHVAVPARHWWDDIAHT